VGWDQSSSRYDFQVARQLSDILDDVERFFASGDMRRWRKVHDHWAPDGSRLQLTFESSLNRKQSLRGRSFLGRAYVNLHWNTPRELERMVQYHFELACTFTWAEAATHVQTLLSETVDPDQQAFAHQHFEVRSALEQVEPVGRRLHAYLAGPGPVN